MVQVKKKYITMVYATLESLSETFKEFGLKLPEEVEELRSETQTIREEMIRRTKRDKEFAERLNRLEGQYN